MSGVYDPSILRVTSPVNVNSLRDVHTSVNV